MKCIGLVVGIWLTVSITGQQTEDQPTELVRLRAEVKMLRATLAQQAEELQETRLCRAENQRLKQLLGAIRTFSGQPRIPQSWLDSFRKPGLEAPALSKIELNKVGHLSLGGIVVQIQDDDEMLVSVTLEHRLSLPPEIAHLPYPRNERLDPNKAYPLIRERVAKVVWMKGLSTKSLADGKKIRLPDLYQVTGTKRYRTTDRSFRTAYILQWVSADRWHAARLMWKLRELWPSTATP